MEYIEKTVSKPALYELLAEEASELAHAALKCARVLRGENPTPINPEEAHSKIIEEYSDLICCARALGIPADETHIEMKRVRWVDRLSHQDDIEYLKRLERVFG